MDPRPEKARRRTAQQLARKREIDKETQRVKRQSDRERLLLIQDDMRSMQKQVHELKQSMELALIPLVNRSTSPAAQSQTPTASPCGGTTESSHLGYCAEVVSCGLGSLSRESESRALEQNQSVMRWRPVTHESPPAGRLGPGREYTSCLCQPKVHVSYGECFEQTVYTALMSVSRPLPSVPLSSIPRLPTLADILFIGPGENIVSRIVMKMLKRDGFKDITNVVSAFIHVYRVLRYRFSPSLETLNDIPEWLRPTETQDIIPHEIWTDFIHFPKLRNAMALKSIEYVRESFDLDYSASISTNWPRWQPVFTWDDSQGAIVLNPHFVPHIDILSNWSLDETFARKYPQIEPLVTIRG
ncbi:uncharacterized protein APUU_50025A [Aspergillus puulaauensis]|uniref:BZIP domain-containing protein n=1 Tax=Aspergillus puulaauensis TaxID=1220207 RepID=A0A7R8AMR9_9EURO|nr:uncharacterized protein APUU_50025A [Aspergillus puulaauensis]BCS25314.1 hypothetical protein APUU_50025A [Aspergillus puulaauensis]